MSRRRDEDLKRDLLKTLAEQGGSAGNTRMIKLLEWGDDQYWRIRDHLVEEGLVVRGRGKGGSILLAANQEGPAVAPVVAAPVPARPEFRSEADLYRPCIETIRTGWCAERGLHDVRVELAANQGSRATGGDWTRPDIVVLSMRTFKHWPGKYFDLWTFEIKPAGQFSVVGIFEAAAHARAATHSYAAFHTPTRRSDSDDLLQRCEAEAARLQIGLVVFSDPADFDTWDIRVEPVRLQPDPELLEQFVATQLSAEAKDTLIRWQK